MGRAVAVRSAAGIRAITNRIGAHADLAGLAITIARAAVATTTSRPEALACAVASRFLDAVGVPLATAVAYAMSGTTGFGARYE